MQLPTSRRARARQLALSAAILLFISMASVLSPERASALTFPAEWKASNGDFYQLPALGTLPADAVPGTIIRWQKFTPSDVLTGGGDGVFSYRIMYVSRDARDERTLVTGAIIIPVRLHTQQYRQIVGFATGTQGMADNCAATYGVQNTTNYDVLYMRRALDEGFTVAVTDYQGLGPKTTQFQSGRADEHTQIVGQILGRNVLDSVRAARQLNNQFNADRAAYGDWVWQLKTAAIRADMSQFSRVLLWGYSEGGVAATSAAELPPSYATELNLVGLAAGGIPADALEVGRAVNRPGSLQNVAFGVLVAAAIGYKAAYPELPLEEKLKPEGLALLANVKQQCLADLIIKNFSFKKIEDYTTNNYSPLSDSLWLSKFAANKLGNKPPRVPVFLYHGVLDEAVEFNQARALAKTYCTKGVNVTWDVHPLFGHAGAWGASLEAAMTFLKLRANNVSPAAGTSCSAI
jgi:pimeloyl-ACP methyl ester carboxylesterase